MEQLAAMTAPDAGFNLEGIVPSEFLRMDYAEAIAVLERTKESC